MHHILICDDERDIVSALDIYLRAEGYATHLAYSGREALEAMEKNEIHLALMDIMMPGSGRNSGDSEAARNFQYSRHTAYGKKRGQR